MLLFLSMETAFGISAAQIGQYYSVLDSDQYSREKRAEYVMTFHDTLSEILSRLFNDENHFLPLSILHLQG